ncbi:glycoside hydrolase 15-like protein [Nitzschia inconspicua]|uniref:Glycoside hydrolase 15-like protein n=1 Tax=Nitzschia inconspicua TaxID=303405 RepID=A0A9K3KI83_9STRA|nr:glycoside hydrolase 15-like protein [Nitzschia inconspicua]
MHEQNSQPIIPVLSLLRLVRIFISELGYNIMKASETLHYSSMSQDELVSISKCLLLAIRKSDSVFTVTPTDSIEEKDERGLLVDIMEEQQKRLQHDVTLKSLQQLFENGKKAFWINIYNSFLQLRLRDHYRQQQQNKGDASTTTTSATPGSWYTTRNIPIGGRLFSLDDVEHGILRKYRWKYLYGYLPHLPMVWCTPIPKLAVKSLDCRIHFALNCGAKSCPPIACYSAEKIDIQLDQATRTFLKQETVMAYTTQEIRISKIFYWYYGDFGGKRGIHELLEKYCLDSSVHGGETGPNSTSEHDKTVEAGVTRDFRLVYKSFSWEQNAHNYAFSPEDISSSHTSQM